MKSYEALQKAISGKTVEHAKRLGRSTSMLSKWQEPHTDYTDPGAYNPLDRIEAIIEGAKSFGVPDDDAYAPIHYLAERFGLITIKAPKYAGELQELSRHLNESIKEFGHMISAATEAMLDGRISRPEYKQIEAEGRDLIRHAMAFLTVAKEAVR